MKIKQLFEEFKTGVKYNGKYYEIFYTSGGKPLKSEEMAILSKIKNLRFMVDYESDMAFFWDASLLHLFAAGSIGYNYQETNYDRKKCNIWGETTLKDGVFTFTDSVVPLNELNHDLNSISTLRYIKKFEKLGNPKSADMIVGLSKELDKYIRKANNIIKKENLKIK